MAYGAVYKAQQKRIEELESELAAMRSLQASLLEIAADKNRFRRSTVWAWREVEMILATSFAVKRGADDVSEIDVPHTDVFDDIKRHLGGIVPCYGDPVGCCANDDANSRHCYDGCLLLKVYKAGYRAGVEACPPTAGPQN